MANINITVDTRRNTVMNIISSNTLFNATIASGSRGKSAYEIWLQEGYVGTEQDFLNWLKSGSYTHDQMVASSEWIITHNLNKFPSVTIVDTANTVVFGEVGYISQNEIRLSFNAVFSGKAYLN